MAIKKKVKALDDDLENLENGMKANSKEWDNLPVKLTTVQSARSEIDAQVDKVKAAELAAQRENLILDALIEKHEPLVDQVESLAIGIHKNDPQKLNDYNIKIRSKKKSKVAPGKAVLAGIEDDSDGIGFVIIAESLEDADGFEIEKSEPQDASLVVLAPPYEYFRTVQKLRTIDDDVEKGKRYFYRIRGYNRRGKGGWSEPLSRVQ